MIPYEHTDAKFSDDKKMRYTLTRQWETDKASKQALVAMLNPSNGNHLKDDPTIRRLTELLNHLGFDGYTIVNWSPFISSKPAAMLDWMNTPTVYRRHMIQENLDHVFQAAMSASTCIVAWGNEFPRHLPVGKFLSNYTNDFLSAMHDGYKRDLYCFGETMHGAPKHPLARGKGRIKNGSKLLPWIGTLAT